MASRNGFDFVEVVPSKGMLRNVLFLLIGVERFLISIFDFRLFRKGEKQVNHTTRAKRNASE